MWPNFLQVFPMPDYGFKKKLHVYILYCNAQQCVTSTVMVDYPFLHWTCYIFQETNVFHAGKTVSFTGHEGQTWDHYGNNNSCITNESRMVNIFTIVCKVWKIYMYEFSIILKSKCCDFPKQDSLTGLNNLWMNCVFSQVRT